MAGIVLDFLPGGTARRDPNEMTRSKAVTEKVSAAPMQGLWSADTRDADIGSRLLGAVAMHT